MLRVSKAALLVAVIGASAVVGVHLYSANSPADVSLADASGRVLAADATPQPSGAPAQESAKPSARAGAPWTVNLEADKPGGRQPSDGFAATPQPSPTAAAPTAHVTPKVIKAKVAKQKAAKVVPAKVTRYVGVNHVWIPALGISKPVQPFSCDRVAPPANYMYRWGCSGTNNVYLLGHAYGPMQGLNTAYNRGTLTVGLRAYYADAAGHTHAYRVIWWKTTRPTTAASWAWASLTEPSMTLQTCVGANSELRLMVRLVEVAY